MVFHSLFIVIDTHATTTLVVLPIVVLRHNGTTSANGSSDDFGTKLGDGIITEV